MNNRLIEYQMVAIHQCYNSTKFITAIMKLDRVDGALVWRWRGSRLRNGILFDSVEEVYQLCKEKKLPYCTFEESAPYKDATNDSKILYDEELFKRALSRIAEV